MDAGLQACRNRCENECAQKPTPIGKLQAGVVCNVTVTQNDCGLGGGWRFAYDECSCRYQCQNFAAGCYEICPNPNAECCAAAPLCWEPKDCEDTEPPLLCERSTRGAPNSTECEQPDTFSQVCETWSPDCSAEACVRVERKGGAYQTASLCEDALRRDCGHCDTEGGGAHLQGGALGR